MWTEPCKCHHSSTFADKSYDTCLFGKEFINHVALWKETDWYSTFTAAVGSISLSTVNNGNYRVS